MARETCGAESIYLLQRPALRCNLCCDLACSILEPNFSPRWSGHDRVKRFKAKGSERLRLGGEAAATKTPSQPQVKYLRHLPVGHAAYQSCNFLPMYEAHCNHSDA
jgi:hypothetical protein